MFIGAVENHRKIQTPTKYRVLVHLVLHGTRTQLHGLFDERKP